MKKTLALSLQRIADIRGHLTSVHVLGTNETYERVLSERQLVSEACFLKLFITLEEFLENSFVHYMTGRMSTRRWRPGKFAQPPSVMHAQNMLRGTQRYVDWSTPDVVVKYAELYFRNGEPFKTTLSSVQSNIQDMKTVRNSTAHLSQTTRVALSGLYTRWTGTPQSEVSAYDMLMARDRNGSQTFYGKSEEIVTTVITNIAECE